MPRRKTVLGPTREATLESLSLASARTSQALSERDQLLVQAAEQRIPYGRIAEAAGFGDASAVYKALKRIRKARGP